MAELTLEELREWRSKCAPDEPLEADDPRYVRFDALGGANVVRGQNWIITLFENIELSSGPTSQLFSGYIGSGKSTELRQLKKMLIERGYLVLIADASRYHNLVSHLEIEDVLVMLAGAVGDQVAAHAGGGALKKGWWQRLNEFLQTELKIAARVGDLSLEFKGQTPFWLDLRHKLRGSLSGLHREAMLFISDAVKALRAKQGDKPIVFILDQLERLRGPEESFKETMQSVVNILTQHTEFLKIPGIHTIYTVPPYVGMLHPNVCEKFHSPVLQVLPAVKVIEADETPYQPGINALREVVRRRVPVDRVFGDRIDLLDRLVLASGGYVRQLLNFVSELLRLGHRHGFPVSEQVVEQTLTLFRENARNAIAPGGVRLLALIDETRSIREIDEDEHAQLAKYLDHHLVLCYRNGETWFAVHPLVRDDVRVRYAALGAATPQDES